MCSLEPSSAPPTRRRHRPFVVLSGLLLGVVLTTLDQMMVATALPTIVGDLGGLTRLPWVVTAYLLASTVTLPIHGKLGDLYGRKPLFLTLIGLFVLASGLCGLVQSMGQLIALRGLQGLAGGGVMVTATTLAGDLVSPRQRGRYQGLFSAAMGISALAGPLLGGFLTDYLSWRWIFLVSVPLGLAALGVTAALLRLPRPETTPRMDVPGAVVAGLAVTAVVLAASWGGTLHPWTSPLIIGLGAVAAALVPVFVLIERRAAEPVIPLRLFRRPTVAICTMMNLVGGVAMLAGFHFLPLFLQTASGATATDSGLLILPLMVGQLVTPMISGIWISHTGRYRAFPILGSAFGVTGMFLVSTMGVGTSPAFSTLSLVLLGAGVGILHQVTVLIVQNAVDPRDLGAATSMAIFARVTGGAIGVSLLGTYFAARLPGELAARLPADVAARLGIDAALRPDTIVALPGPQRLATLEAFAATLSGVFAWCVPFFAVTLLLAFLVKQVPLSERAAAEATATEPVRDR